MAWVEGRGAHLQHVQVRLELARRLLEALEELRLRAQERERHAARDLVADLELEAEVALGDRVRGPVLDRVHLPRWTLYTRVYIFDTTS